MPRPMQSRPGEKSEIVALPRMGGLHHRYTWAEAAYLSGDGAEA